jgi:hypothetical protein
MADRGGRRRRWIRPGYDARVNCPGGRWGPRRVRTSECYAVLKAEDCYTSLLADDPTRVGPGSRGTVTMTVSGRGHTAWWEVRSNAVWRRGRVFLTCERCDRRCTRLYLPLETSWLACRRCWGLTYTSRTLHNYKTSLWGRSRFAAMFGTTQREWAVMYTDDRRQERREASRQRWEKRRPVLARLATTNRLSSGYDSAWGLT